MHKQKSLFLFLLSLLFIMGCKKYPDGGYQWLAKRKLGTRSGTSWSITKYEVNGIDSTEQVVTSDDPTRIITNADEYRRSYARFYKSGNTYYYSTKGAGPFAYSYETTYLSLVSSGKGAYDKLADGIKIREVLTPRGSTMKWKIVRFKDKEMVLNSSIEDLNYVVVLNEHSTKQGF